MNTMLEVPIPIPADQLVLFCRRHRVRRLALFGSVLRGDFRPESDVDVLVEFEPGVRIGLFGFQALENELSNIFGRKVDLNTKASSAITSVSRFYGRRVRSMSRHDDQVRLGHMLDHALEAVAMCGGRKRADLDSDRMLNLSLVRLSRS